MKLLFSSLKKLWHWKSVILECFEKYIKMIKCGSYKTRLTMKSSQCELAAFGVGFIVVTLLGWLVFTQAEQIPISHEIC